MGRGEQCGKHRSIQFVQAPQLPGERSTFSIAELRFLDFTTTASYPPDIN